MIEIAIRNGTVVDGTGGPPFAADIGIDDGRVTAIGDVRAAERTINAAGLVVAPGFIDVHTHYDAQVMWDPALTPSCLHGVTTVIGGNCGFTIAPVDESSRDYVMQMLACVEGMPVESLAASLDWEWNGFGEWLAQLDGRVTLNAGFSVGHSTIRRLVMGDDWRRAATADEVEAMERLVDESLDAGALGFTSSWGEAHGDHLGNPVPSRFADEDELIRLATRLRDRPGTMLEFIPSILPTFPERSIDVMVEMAVAAGRPLNWNVISVGTGADRDAIARRLLASNRAEERGGKIVALTLPIAMRLRLNLLTSIAFNSVPEWGEILTLPLKERLAALVEPDTRERMVRALDGMEPRIFLDFPTMTVESVASSALRDLVGRTIADIAAERGCRPVDAFLDIARADELRTCFATPLVGDDEQSWATRLELWRDSRTLIGASDAGAHLDMLATFGYFTDFIGPTVRDRRLLSLEDAVHHITAAPARLYGLEGRGSLRVGNHADVVVFDRATVRSGTVVMRDDMPAGESRLFADAVGIEHVLVNGVEILTHGELTGATPGIVLRGGRDTR